MSSLRIKVVSILLIVLLVVSEFAPQLLFTKVLAQESPETFVSRLEAYLKDALPSESEPIEEAEYIVPQGFNSSYAERLWRAVAPLISLGYSEGEIANITKSLLSTNESKEVKLNLSGLAVERLRDGSVKLRIPLVEKQLNFTYYNSTNIRILYKTWNESLVSYYRIRRRVPGVYSYVIKDLGTGKEYTIVSRVSIGTFSIPFYGMLEPSTVIERFYFPSYSEIGFWGASKWEGVITYGIPVIAVPGHYEDIKVAVPEQKTKFRVLFPSYDPLILIGWVVYTNISSTSINVGETLKIFYEAIPVNIDPNLDQLNATLRLNASNAFKLLNSAERKLNNTSTSGEFDLEALKPGTYNITMEVEGNAILSSSEFNKVVYTVQVSSLPSPSVRLVVKGMDTSILKAAKILLEVKNEGGSSAKSIHIRVSGNNIESTSREIGDLEVGEARDEEFTLRLLKQWSNVKVCAEYKDDSGNPYLSEAYTTVYTENYVVPEHYEEYTTIIPEHEEIRRVFVPGYEGYTHVRFYAFTLSQRVTVSAGWIYGAGSKDNYYGGAELQAELFPCTPYGYELSVTKELSKEVLEKTGVNLVLTRIEPVWEDLGVFEEENLTKLVGESLEQIEKTPENYEATLVNRTWRAGSYVVLNSTEFEVYKLRMENFAKSKGEDFRWSFVKFTNATRVASSSNETSLVLIYHPVKVRGSGPLRSIQVKNYANYNLSYRIEVEQFSQPYLESLEFSFFSKPLLVPAVGYNTTLASLNSQVGYIYIARIFLGSRLVAEATFSLTPETSPFWQGFWDGIKEKAPGIILSTAILVVIALPSGGSSILAEAQSFLASCVVPMLVGMSAAANLKEILEAWNAYSKMEAVANELHNISIRANSLGYKNFSLLVSGVENKIRESQKTLAIDTGLDILDLVAVRDFFVTFGNENSTEYEKGKAWGKLVGTALSLTTYVLVYYKFFSEGPKLLSLRGKIKSLLDGVYNWITPPIWDVGVMAGKLAASEVASSLILSEQNQKFKDYLDSAKEESISSTSKFVESYFNKALDLSENLELSERAFLGLLWVYENGAEKLGDEDWSKFLGNIEAVGSKNSKFADEFLSWMLSAEDPQELEKATVELTPKLTELEDEELNNLGKALEAISDEFENGIKLFNTYFQISDSYESLGKDAVEKISTVLLKNVESDGVKALDAWSKAVENGGIALRTKVSGTPYPRFWKDLWSALSLKEGDPFTVVVNYEGEECRIPAEVKDVSGDYVLSPFRRGSFVLLQGGEYVEAYPGLRNPSLFMEVESEEGATYVFTKDNWFEKRYVEEHGGEGLQIIMYKKVGSSFDEHYIMRDMHFEGVETPAIYFKPYDGPGVYKIEFVKKVEVKDLCDYVKNLGGDYQLAFDESSGKFRLTLFSIPLESVISKYEDTIGKAEERVGGYEIIFPLQTEEKTWALALLFSVDPKNGELTSKFNFAYSLEAPAWRHVIGLKTYKVGDDKVFQITFELADHDQTARIKWDESLEKFTSYKVRPGSLLESIMKDFLSKDYFSEPQFEGDATKGSMTMRVVKNIREYLTWYNDAAHGFGDHAQGVAGNMVGDAFFLKKFKDRFGIQGELIIDETGQNLGENIFDEFVKEGNKILWCSEWKSTYSEETDLGSRLSDAKTELMKRVDLVKNKVELPEYGYAFAIRITESYVEILWEKVKIPKP